MNLATLNTRGAALAGTRLSQRYRFAGAAFEEMDVDVVAFQEVLTYVHLRLLTTAMPSFRVRYRRTPVGPAGGLVVFARLGSDVPGVAVFHRLPTRRAATDRLSRRVRWMRWQYAALVVPFGGLRLVTVHPVANVDGDWTPGNRYEALQEAQLTAVAEIAGDGPVVVCGDFNVDRDSDLFGRFMVRSGLTDAFGGDCPPTFHADYLPVGREPHCIDHILVGGGVTARDTGLLFTGRQELPDGPGHVSDHIGLRVRVTA